MILEESLDDEQVIEIYRYWIPKEILFYYNIMLHQIDDERNTTEDNMWQQPTYKLVFEEVEGMLRKPRRMEDLHQKMKKVRFEVYNKKKKLKQFRGYRIWKKRRIKFELNF